MGHMLAADRLRDEEALVVVVLFRGLEKEKIVYGRGSQWANAVNCCRRTSLWPTIACIQLGR